MKKRDVAFCRGLSSEAFIFVLFVAKALQPRDVTVHLFRVIMYTDTAAEKVSE